MEFKGDRENGMVLFLKRNQTIQKKHIFFPLNIHPSKLLHGSNH